MAVYAITGKLGSGKGKGAMKLLRDYLNAGKRVATNCDVFLEHMLPGQSRVSLVRMPDKPDVADLYAIGSGNRFIDFEPIIKSYDKAFEYLPPSPKLLPGFDESYNPPSRFHPRPAFSCLVSCDHIPRRSMALFRAKAVLDELIGGLPPRSSHRLQHIA